MADFFHEDFIDFIKAFNECHVDYILVGGYAVIYHGYGRTTGDLDLWVRANEENYKRIEKAFRIFHMPLGDMTLDNFLSIEKFDVFKYGRSPVKIDVMTVCKGLNFEEVFLHSSITTIQDVAIRVIDIRDLLAAKRAAGRPKDLDDITELENRE